MPRPRRFPAQEVGFHLDIAIAEQQHFHALAGDAEIVKAVGGADRPIGGRPLLQVAPVAFEDFGGIAPVLGRQFSADRGQFFVRGLLGQNLARAQFHHRAFHDRAQIGRRVLHIWKQSRHGVAVFGDAARLGEIVDQPADVVIGGQSHMADRVNDQRAILADGQLMNEAGAAQDHTSL